jgi:KaiC/GvpD/RAD55 family RecA-like ATPase
MKTVSSDNIEPIMTKLVYVNPKMTNLMMKYFDESWFEDKIYSRIIVITCKFFEQYTKLPKFSDLKLLVNTDFNGKENQKESEVRLKTLASIDLTKYNEEYLLDESVKYLKKNGLYQTLMESIGDIEDCGEIVCFEELQAISRMTFDDGLGLDYLENFDEHVEELNSPDIRTSTGWSSLDHKTNGGFYSDGRCLVTFVAETGMGKSLMLSNIAASWLKMGKFAVIISLEMSENVYATRIDAHLSKMPIGSITKNLKDLSTKIHEFKERNMESKLVIKEYPPETVTSIDIKNYLDNLITSVGRKPDILLVDYINLLMPSTGNKSDNSYSKIGRVTRDLRALSYIYNCPVISATQSNRDAYGTGDPSIDQISESMAIGHVSDLIGQLYQQSGEREAGIINLKITKNRLGGIINTSISFDIDYETLIIADSTRPTISDDLQDCISDKLDEVEE